jgi:uncharacterized protein (DUF1810 family)
VTGSADPLDPFGLERFVRAQDGPWGEITDELTRGRKETHWMWFVFPLISGLGSSPTAQRYWLHSVEAVRAYWGHPVLGARLRWSIEAALQVQGRTAREIFGKPDDWKFHCCLTVFGLAVPDEPLFQQGLDAYFGGVREARAVAAFEALPERPALPRGDTPPGR